MKRPLALALILACSSHPGWAEEFDARAAATVLEQVDAGLASYFDPAAGHRAQTALNAKRSELVTLGNREAFADAVTAVLISTTGDKHLKLRIFTEDTGSKPAELTDAQWDLIDRQSGYGLLAVRRLPANIGYLKLRYFEQTEPGAAMVVSALRLLKDTDTLIIDLRANTGGGGAADAALLGHLSRDPIPMAALHWRAADGSETIEQRSVRPPDGGALYPDKPIFVLTSSITFSAAEEVAYDLKLAGRARLIGETTRGGANPSNRNVPVSHGFRVVIPNGHAVHPVTGGNWDGTGVTPDISVPAEKALTVAYTRALEAARPTIIQPAFEEERRKALADPLAALTADQPL